MNSICNEFAQHKKIIGKKMPIFAQEYKIAKSVAMEIKLDRKKNHIAASDYKEQTTVIKTTSDFKIGNNVDTNKIEGNYMVKREKETLIKIIELRKSQRDIILTLNVSLYSRYRLKSSQLKYYRN